MKFILATKKGMTQVFDESGRVRPATVLTAGPVMVAQIKTVAKDGYNAVQVGYGDRPEKNVSKPVRGHLKDLKMFRYLREFRNVENTKLERGSELNVSQFSAGEFVTVSGISKGKGFQGVVKRHGFAGGPRSHGQKHSEREPGSIGATGPQKVLKGTRMAGRTGSDRVTIKNLMVVAVDKADNILVVKGAVPGRRGTLLEVRV